MRPVLFNIGSITVHSHGTMMGIAFMAGILIAMARAEKLKINPDAILNLGIVAIITSIVGARLLFVVENFDRFMRSPIDIIMIQRGGLTFYGGFIGGYLSSVAYLRLKGLRIWKVGDLLAPSIILGLGITRIGCFLNGDDFGTPTDLPWGISFPAGSFANQIAGDQNLHPTQLYEMAVAFIMVGVLIFMERRKKFDGQVFWSLVIIYGVARFFIEFVRGDMIVRAYIGNPFWNNARIIGLIGSVIAIFMMIRLSKVKEAVLQTAATGGRGGTTTSKKRNRKKKRRK